MTLANKFTIARIIMAPIFVAVAAIGPDKAQYWAAMLFCIASLTDMIDGEIARRFNQISDFGKLMDPIADKLLTCSAMLVLVQWGRLPGIVAIILIARDHVMSGIRIIAAGGGNVIAASFAGKAKTFLQMFSFIFLLMNWRVAGNILLVLAVIMTIWSLYEYIKGSMPTIRRAGLWKFASSFLDKLIIAIAVIVLIELGAMSQILGIIFIGRDIITSGLKMTKAASPSPIGVRITGVLRFIVQFFAFLLMFVDQFRYQQTTLANVFLVLAVIMTAISAIDYIYAGRDAFNVKK